MERQTIKIISFIASTDLSANKFQHCQLHIHRDPIICSTRVEYCSLSPGVKEKKKEKAKEKKNKKDHKSPYFPSHPHMQEELEYSGEFHSTQKLTGKLLEP